MGWTYTKALRGEPSATPSKPARKKATPSSTAKPRPTIQKARPTIPKLPTPPKATTNASIPNAPLNRNIPRSDTLATTNPISQPVPTQTPNPISRPVPIQTTPISNPIRRPVPNPATQAFMARTIAARRALSFAQLKSRPPASQQSTPSPSVSIETVKKRVPTAKRATHTPKTLAKAIADYQMKGGVKRGIDADESSTRPTKALQKQKNLPILDNTFSLKYIIKGHTDINPPVRAHGETEDSKDLWCCEFEPSKHSEQKSDVAAICGSYSVLLLDTQQGRYIKKYTHSETQEIFYCMAWTTLQGDQLLNTNVNEEDESCNILAVAGRLGSIKLLNPLQGECYRYLFGHRTAVLALTFAKAEPRWLFSACADHTVRLWDIGSPTSKIDDSVCLAKFNLPPKAGIPSTVSVSFDLSTVMVGCDNGDMIRFTISERRLQKFREKSNSDREKQAESGDKWTLEPISTITPTMIYPEGDEWHEGYIDDICILGQDGDTESPLYDKIVSRGSDDMEIILWDPIKSEVKDAEIEMSLDWPDSGDCTGLRFKVIEQHSQKVLIAGEYEGQIYIYDIGSGKKSKTLDDNSKELFEPSKILAHTMSSELIRDVSCSSDTSTIVAVDNNNTVFVWTSS